jgi:hypothetical protein
MRTTVAFDDPLLENAKRHAAERGITLGALMEDALRSYFSAVQQTEVCPFRLHTVRGWLVNPALDMNRTSELLLLDDEEQYSKRTP